MLTVCTITAQEASKRIVTDLKQQDFKIQEDGQDQQIAFFSREVTLPITLALLLDTSGSEQFMLGAIQQMGGRAKAFAAGVDPNAAPGAGGPAERNRRRQQAGKN